MDAATTWVVISLFWCSVFLGIIAVQMMAMRRIMERIWKEE